MAQSVILLSDVAGLGQLGDQCKVKDGYARNYLIPLRLAASATAKTPGTLLKLPSKDSSPKNIFPAGLKLVCSDAESMANAMGKSKCVPNLGTSAGAKFTDTRVGG